jgi:hypothetical protein
MADTFEQLVDAPEGRFEGIERDYSVEDVKNSVARFRSNIHWPAVAPIVCGKI